MPGMPEARLHSAPGSRIRAVRNRLRVRKLYRIPPDTVRSPGAASAAFARPAVPLLRAPAAYVRAVQEAHRTERGTIMGNPGSGRSFDGDHDYQLASGRLLRVHRARGWTVYCEYGELLLTQEGDVRDFVLRAGDRIGIHTHGRVLVEAFGGSGLRLMQAKPCHGPARSPGRPVVRLVPARAGAAFDRHAGRCAAMGPLTYERVFRSPRLLEQLVERARRERGALLAACAAAALAGVAGLALRAGRLSAGLVRGVGGAAAGLRPRLPSLQETFAALVFLRSRL